MGAGSGALIRQDRDNARGCSGLTDLPGLARSDCLYLAEAAGCCKGRLTPCSPKAWLDASPCCRFDGVRDLAVEFIERPSHCRALQS